MGFTDTLYPFGGPQVMPGIVGSAESGVAAGVLPVAAVGVPGAGKAAGPPPAKPPLAAAPARGAEAAEAPARDAAAGAPAQAGSSRARAIRQVGRRRPTILPGTP